MKRQHAGHYHLQTKDKFVLLDHCGDGFEVNLAIDLIRQSLMAFGTDFKVPDMPELVCKIEHEMYSDHPNVHRMTAIIEENPLVTAELLSSANHSSFQRNMRRPVEITSVLQCLNFIGMERTYRLAVAAALKNIKGNGVLFKEVIDHSSIVARTCVEVAGYVNGVSLETAYLYGLFKNAGMIFMAHKYGEDYRKIFTTSMTNPVRSAEMSMSQFRSRPDHLGVAVVRKWGLGESKHEASEIAQEDKALLLSIQEQFHRNSPCIKNELVRKLVAIGQIADVFTNDIVMNIYIGEDAKAVSQKAIKALHLSDEAVSAIRYNMNDDQHKEEG